ncbi:MAG: MerR family transcriptional regulator [Polyangiaceae bacterium]|nr:MerR family transcriptional regulator [Polyangiaceae bacterium]
MQPRRTYRVKDVARMTGVSVRALHHYDEIRLLVPSDRSRAGYRLYTDEDLLRLQQILIGRELGLSLEAIRRSLDDPAFDRAGALRAQREALLERARATAEMIRAVDRALAIVETSPSRQSNEGGTMDMKEIFEGFDPGKYEEEAKARWGNTDAYRISKERAKSYGPEQYAEIRDEQTAIYRDAASAMNAGAKPDDDAAMDIAERHRSSIDRWFYPCSYRMHVGLADLYETDTRFADNIDKHGAGLTAFLSSAIRANARRNGRSE